MAKKKSAEPERDMSAYIPEGTDTAHEVERNMDAKMGDELGDGLHTTSTTFGEVVSDHAADAAGNTPEDIAAAKE